MKTKSIFLMGFTAASIVAHAQLVIPAGGYSIIAPTDTIIGGFASGAGFPVPSEGPNQVWDYSGVTSGTPFTNGWELPNNPNFPNATAGRSYNPSLGPINLIGSRDFFLTDADGVYQLGFESAANTYSIAAITGNPSDELEILNTFNNYGKDYPIVEFPMNYMDVYYPQVVGETSFNLTVAAFGLNATPGQIKQYVTITDTICGWGAVTVGVNGMTGAPGLLKKTIYHQIDSVFLGGAPAPEALLTAFGLTQGAVLSFTDYRIFVYDGQTRLLPALSFDLDANGTAVETIRYDRANYSNLSTSDVALREAVKLYPNPAVENFLTVEMPQAPNDVLDIQIINMNGQVVANAKYDKNADRVMVDLQACAPGNYYVKITDRNGNLMALRNFIRL
ncbi:MAG: T9SS type A sorting domain-containing protein [Schleiferiaceae bacterium]|nr:T9SS type A sorting domain-containing protein [Schleiferiaceae bacterium]